MIVFEWDPEKAKKNKHIHGVTFDEASTIFVDDLSLLIYDPLHSVPNSRTALLSLENHLKIGFW